MDELGEVRKANPVDVQDVDPMVAIDRRSLIDAFHDETDQHRRAKRQRPWATLRQPAFAGLLVASAVVAFLVLTVADPRSDRDAVIEATVASPVRVIQDPGGFDLGETPRFNRDIDLLVMHLDYRERSDAHAAVAAREVTTWFDLDALMVAGTQGTDSRPPTHGYGLMMQSAWDDHWIDAATDRQRAISRSAERWLRTVDAGGRVWVAEGGVLDFTAEMLREIARRRPDLDTTSSIYVIQHRDQNETDTRPGDLALVQATTSYLHIDDGDSSNETADLAGPSGSFETMVLAGCHREQWLAAFDLASSGDLDFSPVVAVLQILGVGTDQVADVEDFADFFIGDQPDAKQRGSS